LVTSTAASATVKGLVLGQATAVGSELELALEMALGMALETAVGSELELALESGPELELELEMAVGMALETAVGSEGMAAVLAQLHTANAPILYNRMCDGPCRCSIPSSRLQRAHTQTRCKLLSGKPVARPKGTRNRSWRRGQREPQGQPTSA
jgi:hypothetical protein